jgi:2-C-methyl-D-erythritol 4-phosphate cytidylyltransferase
MSAPTACVWAIIAAAGESRRMGLPDGESKQFLRLGDGTILSHSVHRLLAINEIAGVVVVVHPSHTVRIAAEVAAFDESKPVLITEGGRTRSESVRAGLEQVPAEVEYIAVHDGARPLFSRHVFEDCLAALADCDGAVPGCAVADTLKRTANDGRVEATVERGGLWSVQTPQLFRAAPLRAVHARRERDAATDDAALLEAAGFVVKIVESTPANVKITTPADLPLAAALLAWELEADI